MKLYVGRNAFNTRDQTMEYIGEADNREQLWMLFDKYLDETHFKKYSHYQRWLCEKDQDDNPMWIVDFGSYTRFFYIYDLSGELLEDWNKLSKGNVG